MSGRRILVVEDEAIVAMDVVNRLKILGYDVADVVCEGQAAIEAALSLTPDLILMDIMLQGEMDGIEAAGLIRQSVNVPIIYLTAYADYNTLQRAKITDPFGYIIKPFEDRELHSAIEMALYKFSLESRLVENERLLSTTLRSIGEAVITTDPRGRVRFLNPAAESLLGLSQDMAMGRELDSIFKLRDEKSGENLTHLFEIPDKSKEISGSMLVTSDARQIPIEETLSPIVDDKGVVQGSVLVMRDITLRKKSELALQSSLDTLRQTMNATVNALTVTSEKRDPYTAGHQQRVAKLAEAIAKYMNLPEDSVEGMRVAGLLHDLGKIFIPAEILSKPATLTAMEMGLIKTHPEVGFDILKDVPFPWPVADIVLQHHERIDGSGYPRGLLGREILLEARIVAVADVVEAMYSHRPYRPALGLDRALDEISKNKGVLYDPKISEACLALFYEHAFSFE